MWSFAHGYNQTTGGEQMNRTVNTPADRKAMAQFLRTINTEPKNLTANAFIAGMEVQKAVDTVKQTA